MTALDQAFIKAFSRQDPIPLALSPHSAAPVNEERKTRNEELFEKQADSGQWPVASEPEITGDRSVILGPLLTDSFLTGESIDTFAASPLPNVDEPNVDKLWAVLEKPPKPMANPPKTAAVVKEIEMPTVGGQWPVVSEEPTVQHSLLSPVSPSLPALVAQREFKPAWQVDHFSWPKLCRRLIDRASHELDRLADALLAANRQGKKVLAIGGCHRGEGATTLLMCAAWRLAERGTKLIVVDADLDRPRIAKRLAVQSQFGWDETTEQEGHLLDQAIVEATADNIAILPAREPSEQNGRAAGDPSRLAACLKTLRNHYDMVLIDVGPLENGGLFSNAWGRSATEWIDAVVVVQNRRVTSEDERQSLEGKLAVAGIPVAGVVENFVAED